MTFPKRFVSLHNHTGFSPYDGLGMPHEHFEHCMSNGLTAHAITEHGQWNSYAHSQLWVEEWTKKNKDKPFKYLPGVEAYFHPDLSQWRRDKELDEQAKDDAKAAKKLKIKQEVETQLLVTSDSDDEALAIDTTNALTVENEDESKSTSKFNNPVNRRHHLVLLPKNSRGLQELFHLTSRSFLEGFFRFPRIDLKMIKETLTRGNVVASSACIAGFPAWSVFKELQTKKFDELLPELLDDPTTMERTVAAVGNVYEMMSGVFGSDYYLELQFNKLGAQDVTNRAIIEFARRNGLTDQLIVTCDAHYYNPDVWKEREIYKKLGYLNYTAYSPDTLPKSKDDLKCELYPKNATQLWEEYQRSRGRCGFYAAPGIDEIVSAAIERTHDIAYEKIGEVKPDRSIKLPKKLVPTDRTPIEHLTLLCIDGMKKRGLKGKSDYVARLKYELDIIGKMDMAEYFITLARILDLAREVVFLGPARGSGGGSLVNYVLYITDLDPLRWDLPFERFMNLARVGIPDIDTDVSNRDKVLDVMRKEFGDTNVVPISNYNLTKVKSLLKDLSKFYGISFEEANKATATCEQEVRKATTKHGDDKNLFVLTYDDAMKYSPSFKTFIENHPEVGGSMKVLFKQNRSLGRHAGGVLVCDDLAKKMPLITSKGEAQTPWVEGVSFKHLEKIGNFIKFDILGLETLRLIERAIELILIKAGNLKPSFAEIRAWFEANMSLDKLDLNDQSVYEYVYHDGRFPGIFQCTSQGAQRLFKKAKPSSVLDIAMLTSIYRPGPLAANVDKLYLEAKNDGKQFDWGDTRINDLLKETYGLLIFQEGVMMLAEKVAGFPKDKCDEVRRAIMKRSISGGDAAKAKVDQMKDDFVTGAVKNGYDKKVASDLYEKIAYFSGYAFNSSHATAYAIDSYWCAWMLKHHEEEWLTSYVESMLGNPENKAEALGYVKSLGYQIVPIDINYAGVGWTVLPGKKFMPSLLSVKGVGETAAEELISQRPYASIEQMLWNDDGTWRHSKFNKKAMDALVKVESFGSLDCVGEGKIFKNYRHMHEVLMGTHTETVTRTRKGVEETVEVERDHASLIKRAPKSDPNEGRKTFFELVRSLDVAEWTLTEKAKHQVEAFGTLDVTAMMEPSVLKKLDERDVKSIDECNSKGIYWFVVQGTIPKKTRNGKPYLILEALGPVGKVRKISAWGWDGQRKIEPLSQFIAEVDRNEFGFSTTMWRLKQL